MKIFTIFKCLIRFLNLLFTILKLFVYVMSVMWRKFSADRSDHAQQQEASVRTRPSCFAGASL